MFLVKKWFDFSDSVLGCSCETPLGTTTAMKKPCVKMVKAPPKVMKASPVMKAAPKLRKAAKKPAGLLKKPAAEPGPGKKTGGKKAPLPGNKVEEEGEEEEVFSEDQVVDPKLTAKNVKTHQQLLSAKLCSAAEIDKAIGKLPQNEQQVLWKKTGIATPYCNAARKFGKK